jgi:hypothetical protein
MYTWHTPVSNTNCIEWLEGRLERREEREYVINDKLCISLPVGVIRIGLFPFRHSLVKLKVFLTELFCEKFVEFVPEKMCEGAVVIRVRKENKR